jgi:hypothetical protein
VRYNLLQSFNLRIEVGVRNDQRANGRAQIAVASSDRLLDGGLQIDGVTPN